MSKLIIMKGLPASGKSTKAKELIADYGNTVRINKDLLRTMLHFDKFNGKNESVTNEASKELARAFLIAEMNVIVDDTNLNPKVIQGWRSLAESLNEDGTHVKLEYVDMTGVDIDECILRDYEREKSVGKDVIINMALRTGLYNMPTSVICDLDGTLCNIDHRLHYVKGERKDWKGFYSGIADDTVNEKVLEEIKTLSAEGHHIVFVSGRPEDYKQVTLDWLKKHGINFFTTLIMRKSGDSRPDDEVKREILSAYFKDKKSIIKVIDDRPRVIRMWREEGLEVMDVGHGVEF